MKTFSAADYYTVIEGLQKVQALFRSSRKPAFLDEEFRAALNDLFELLLEDWKRLGFRATVSTVQKLRELGEDSDSAIPLSQVGELLRELSGRLQDEMAETSFFSLDPQEALAYHKWWTKWETVLDQFGSTEYDIEEASKCLAVGRYTACVFHLMRIMEVGLRALAKTLNNERIDPGRNPSWDSILKKCRDELDKERSKRAPEWAADEAFFSAAYATLMAVKVAWRNPTMHVEINYDEERAMDVWTTVRTFMRHLATKLTDRD